MWIQSEVVARLVDDAKWQLVEPIIYQYHNVIITALPGFVTDFASIPAWYKWRFDPQDKDYAAPAVIHDILYASEFMPREVNDDVFNQAMMDNDTGDWTRGVLHKTVRLGGGFTYRAHTRQTIAKAGLSLKVEVTPPPIDYTHEWSNWPIE